MSQAIFLVPTTGPGSGSVTSITFNGGLTSSPDPITAAGTATLDQTGLTVLDGTVYWDTGTQLLNTTATGTAGQILTSQGSGLPPLYADAPAGGITTIDGDVGSVSGSTVSFTGLTTAGATVSFDGSGTAMTFNVSDVAGNTFVGTGSGTVGAGGSNTGFGNNALNAATNVWNTAVGGGAGIAVTTGMGNTFLGLNAGSNYTGSDSNNISIGAFAAGTSGQSNVLSIGSGTGTGNGALSTAFISGINGNTLGGTPLFVVIDPSTDQLGVTSGGGGGGITTIDVDQGGSVTGSTIDLFANSGSANAGSSVMFVAVSGAEIDLQTSDANQNTNIGSGSGNSSMVANGASTNCCIGVYAGHSLTSGSSNMLVGEASGFDMTTDSYNVGIGQGSFRNANGCNDNIAIGTSTLYNLLTGTQNLALGGNSNSSFAAGVNYTSSESNNIAIQSPGVTGESNVLRIGFGTGTSTGQINSAFICGITGITVIGAAVLVSTGNQLGVAVSSAKYKDNIRDMDNYSSQILSLRPTIFNYKGSEETTGGLIAEEVNDIMPSLVVYDKQGDPQTVKYHELPALLLNELQKALKRIAALEEKLNGK